MSVCLLSIIMSYMKSCFPCCIHYLNHNHYCNNYKNNHFKSGRFFNIGFNNAAREENQKCHTNTISTRTCRQLTEMILISNNAKYTADYCYCCTHVK